MQGEHPGAETPREICLGERVVDEMGDRGDDALDDPRLAAEDGEKFGGGEDIRDQEQAVRAANSGRKRSEAITANVATMTPHVIQMGIVMTG